VSGAELGGGVPKGLGRELDGLNVEHRVLHVLPDAVVPPEPVER